MFSGVKFVPRDQLLSSSAKPHSDSDGSGGEEKKYSSAIKKSKTKKRSKRDGGDASSEDDVHKMISRRGKRVKNRNKKNKRSKKHHSSYDDDDDDESDDSTLRTSDSESLDSKEVKRSKSRRKRRRRRQELSEDDYSSSSDEYAEKKEDSDDDGRDLLHQNDKELARKELGLDWMLRPASRTTQNSHAEVEEETEEHKTVEVTRTNPKELNPYLKDNGSGYPDDASISEASDRLFSSSVVGDGGASWRLKALKRAKEQAAREGRKLDEVVEERWGSLGQLTATVVTHRAAPAHAHLRAINDRKRGPMELSEVAPSDETKGGFQEVHSGGRDYLRDVSSQTPQMRKPRHDDLSWKRNKGHNMSREDKSLISSAISSLNKFANDGSFMDNIAPFQSKEDGISNSSSGASPKASSNCMEKRLHTPRDRGPDEESSAQKHVQSANQLAAKVLQLRMKGKHDEAEKLSKEMEAMVDKSDAGTQSVRVETEGSRSRYIRKQMSREHKRREDDADLHLAKTIMQSKQYSLGEDEEYGFDVAPSRKRNKKKEEMPAERSISRRLLTQQERCQFCFENPSRPKHLVVSIANFTYLMLPQWQPVVEGHCCILPMQHEAATRSVDKNVWEEIRNFKKCLLKMFARDDKDVVFLETVVGLAKQRRHCLLECIPIPHLLASQAPMYFRKAIEEAEEEWGQHDMKKVIPTSGNLRQVIPENFSYFHVEFGLDKGFVHVIDKDSNFDNGFGLNVVRGLLRLPEEDMYRRRRHEPMEKQKQAVANFAREWEHFDWTRDLD
ncbi:Protein similar to CwfJ C-terminus 2 [Musa troglodytarum]|uniref:Protein similar to CwfJ C-terminus 2 n=1 Tax=Musa troglodytarum TaxID=320322 RepID=A0A9E7EHG5_9LILI|nr:Protein similar to CwfJ C-terminus 2 [Musa troglodytarum]